MNVYSEEIEPAVRARRISNFEREMSYLLQVLLLGYLPAVSLFWVINQVFISEFQRAPLADIMVAIPALVGLGIRVAPTVFLLVLSLYMFVRAKRLKRANLARFWRGAIMVTAIASPIVTGLLFGWATNWRFGPNDYDPGYDADYWYFIFPLYSTAVLVIWLVLGWALRAAIVKLFSVIRGRPAVEVSAGN